MLVTRFICGLIVLHVAAFVTPTLAQPGLKVGYGLTGIVQVGAEPDALGDYRSFFGYETDDLQGYPADGLQINLFYTIPVSNWLAVQPEVSYAQRGMDGYAKELYDISYRLELDYVEFGAPAVVRPKPGWRIRPGVLLGPYVAALVRDARTISEREESDRASLEQVSDFEAGLLAGIDAMFETWIGWWTLELRFNWGLTHAVRRPDGYVSLYEDPGTMHTAAVTILMGFRLR